MSIRKRGNKYYYTVFVTDENGVRRRIERAGTGDLRETRKIERAAQADADLERFQILSSITVDRFYEQWMEEALVPSSFTVNTIRSYRSAVINHILPCVPFAQRCACPSLMRRTSANIFLILRQPVSIYPAAVQLRKKQRFFLRPKSIKCFPIFLREISFSFRSGSPTIPDCGSENAVRCSGPMWICARKNSMSTERQYTVISGIRRRYRKPSPPPAAFLSPLLFFLSWKSPNTARLWTVSEPVLSI